MRVSCPGEICWPGENAPAEQPTVHSDSTAAITGDEHSAIGPLCWLCAAFAVSAPTYNGLQTENRLATICLECMRRNRVRSNETRDDTIMKANLISSQCA